jgi:hypothetical protein
LCRAVGAIKTAAKEHKAGTANIIKTTQQSSSANHRSSTAEQSEASSRHIESIEKASLLCHQSSIISSVC